MNSKRAGIIYDRKSRIIFIIILVIGVVGLSIGFSAYSKALNIQNIQATVAGDPSNFKVLFSSARDKVVDGNLNVGYSIGASGTTAAIDNSDPTHPKITGIKAKYTKPGTYVTYIFYAINQGRYDAYLKNITYGKQTCTAKDGTSQELVDQICKKIRLLIFVNENEDNRVETANTTSVSNHLLKKGEAEVFKVYMDYMTDAAVADGDFDVEFGDITLTYSSSDA